MVDQHQYHISSLVQ